MIKAFRSLKQGYLDMPLVYKMVLMYIFIIFIPMVLLGVNYISTIGKSLERQYADGKRNILLQSTEFVEKELGMVEFCTSCIQYNNSLLEYIEYLDFSTADGVAAYLETVRPVFEQLRSINGRFEAIRVYRKLLEGKNDIHYVLNRSEQPNLQSLGEMNLRDIRLFLSGDGGATTCRLYKVLYNGKYSRQIGYTEVVCPFEEMFGSLNFFGEGERVTLRTADDQLWLVERGASGGLYLESRTAIPEADRYETAELPQLGIQLTYCYGNLHILSTREMVTSIAFVVTMLVLLVVLFLITYSSITRRIANFTNHLRTSGALVPYENDPFCDEIGQMIRRFNKTIIRQNQLTEEIYQKERLAGQAQYYALQSQIQPHFLYNTLENIDMLIAVGDNRAASKMIALFGKILRYNVSRTQEKTTLGDEMDHIEDYLKLYAFRMSEDFRYQVEMPPELRPVACPYCMLQPLIENCFKHGFRHETLKPWIRIAASRDGVMADILIEDNGRGITKEQAGALNEALLQKNTGQAAGSSIGLQNVHDRIRLLCGEGCGLRVISKENGFAIVIRLKQHGENAVKEGSYGNPDCG